MDYSKTHVASESKVTQPLSREVRKAEAGERHKKRADFRAAQSVIRRSNRTFDHPDDQRFAYGWGLLHGFLIGAAAIAVLAATVFGRIIHNGG